MGKKRKDDKVDGKLGRNRRNLERKAILRFVAGEHNASAKLRESAKLKDRIQ